MVGSQQVRLIDYDRGLIDIINERSTNFEESMAGLAIVAQQVGDQALLTRVEQSRKRYQELQAR